MSRILIIHRRGDAAWARRLDRDLITAFGGRSARADDGRPRGAAPAARIESTLGADDIVLVLIGSEWSGGRRSWRVADLDMVRLEQALQHRDVTVIPILVGGAPMPAASELPPALRPLVDLRSVALTDAHWFADLEGIVSAVAMASAPPVEPAPPAPAAPEGGARRRRPFRRGSRPDER